MVNHCGCEGNLTGGRFERGRVGGSARRPGKRRFGFGSAASQLVRLAVTLFLLVQTSQSVFAQTDATPEIVIRLQFARAGGIYDPHYSRVTADYFVQRGVFNTLVRMTPGMGGSQLGPDLAESWEVSADGTEYVFNLRRGVQFHRGYGEMTAEDVVFSFRRQMEDDSALFNSLLGVIAEVEAVDPYTVRFRLHEAQPSFLRVVIANRSGYVVSRKAVEELGPAFADTPVGTGPYVLEGLNAAGEVLLTRHDDYYRGAPDAARVRFVHIGEEAVVATALESGEVQVAYSRGNPEIAQQLLNSETVHAETVVEYYNLMHVQMSPNFEPTQSLLVRQALAYALNKDFIPDLLPGLDQPAHVMRPATLAGGTDDVRTYPYDPERARELLAEAGYANGFQMRLMFQVREPESTIAQLLAEAWRAVGIDVVLEGTDATAAFERRDSGDFDVTFAATSRPGDPDLFFSNLFHSDSIPPQGSNFFHYSGADALIEAARSEFDEDRRDELYHELQAQLMEELPIIPLLYRAFVAAWRSPVASLQPDTTLEFWLETVELED